MDSVTYTIYRVYSRFTGELLVSFMTETEAIEYTSGHNSPTYRIVRDEIEVQS